MKPFPLLTRPPGIWTSGAVRTPAASFDNAACGRTHNGPSSKKRPVVPRPMYRVTELIVIATLLLPGLCGGTVVADPLPVSAEQRQALGIKTAPVEAVEQSWSIPYPAQVVVPNAQLRVVSALQSGLLESLLVAEGQKVKKGQALAIIQSPQLLEQQRNYLTALSRLDLAKTDWKRDEQLFQEGIIAERRYLESLSRYRQARTEVEQYRQALNLVGMGKQSLQKLASQRRLSGSLTVRAPLDGVVLEQLATPGQQLNPLDPIYRIGRLVPLWLEIQVPLKELGNTSVGSMIRVNSTPRLFGKVITIGRMVHGVDQGVMVRAGITEGAEHLHPGQFVQVELARTSAGQSFRIPSTALVRQGDRVWVFAEHPAGFQPVAVTVTAEEADAVVVNAALKPDDRIVVAGTVALKAIWLEGDE